MVNVEARVQIVEERMTDYQDASRELAQQLGRFEARVDARFAAVDRRFTAIDERFTLIDGRFALIDGRFTGLEGRITALDQKVDTGFALIGQEMAALRRDMTMRMSTQLRWTAGLMLTGFVAIAAVVVAR